MQHSAHDHCLPSSYEYRKPPLTSQPQYQPHSPTCLVILSVWLEMGGLCVCVCMCVCVCVCVYVSLKRYASHATRIIRVLSRSAPRFTSKSTPYILSLLLAAKPKPTWTYLHEPHGKVIFFDFPFSISTTFLIFWNFWTNPHFCFWFLFLVSCLPADEATAKSDRNLSTRFGKQTAT